MVFKTQIEFSKIKLTPLLLLAVTLFSITSCSVQKRRYLKGFYVHRSSHKTMHKKEESIIHSDFAVNPTIQNKQKQAVVKLNETENSQLVKTRTNTNDRSLLTGAKHEKTQKATQSKLRLGAGISKSLKSANQKIQQSLKKDDGGDYKEKKFMISGVLGMVFGLIVLILAPLSIVFISLSVPLGIPLLLVSFLLTLAALILSIIGVVRKISEPESYSGVGFAIAGIVICIINVLFLLLLVTVFL